MPTCPLCHSMNYVLYAEDKKRTYYRCKNCYLVFTHPQSYPTRNAEKKRYELHENDILNEGYQRFLNQVILPLLSFLPVQCQGLDFGSGPSSALRILLQEKGYTMDAYDPFFNNDTAIFYRKYDFIVLSEVVEHMFWPWFSLLLMFSMLKPGGYAGIMTQCYDDIPFTKWFYKNDFTHVCFYSKHTIDALSRMFGLSVVVSKNPVFILQKDKV